MDALASYDSDGDSKMSGEKMVNYESVEMDISEDSNDAATPPPASAGPGRGPATGRHPAAGGGSTSAAKAGAARRQTSSTGGGGQRRAPHADNTERDRQPAAGHGGKWDSEPDRREADGPRRDSAQDKRDGADARRSPEKRHSSRDAPNDDGDGGESGGQDRRHNGGGDKARSEGEDRRRTGSAERLKSDGGDKRRSGSRDKRRSGSRDKRRSGSRDKRRSGSRDKRRSGSRDKRRSGSRDKRRSGSRDKRRSGSRDRREGDRHRGDSSRRRGDSDHHKRHDDLDRKHGRRDSKRDGERDRRDSKRDGERDRRGRRDDKTHRSDSSRERGGGDRWGRGRRSSGDGRRDGGGGGRGQRGGDRRDRSDRHDRDRRSSRSPDRKRHTSSEDGGDRKRTLPSPAVPSTSMLNPFASYKPASGPDKDKVRERLEKLRKQGGMEVYQQIMSGVPQPAPGMALPRYFNPTAMNMAKFADQERKKKLLWGSKKAEQPAQESEPANPADAIAAAGVWQTAAFERDKDGKMATKFLKLMGVKNAQEVASANTEASAVVEKQKKMFQDMELQYEQARVTTHSAKGFGLGYTTQYLQPKS